MTLGKNCLRNWNGREKLAKRMLTEQVLEEGEADDEQTGGRKK